MSRAPDPGERPPTPDRAGLTAVLFGVQVVSRPSEYSPSGFSWVATAKQGRRLRDLPEHLVAYQDRIQAQQQRAAVAHASGDEARFRRFVDPEM